MPRTGKFCALLLWIHMLQFSAAYCPGITLNSLLTSMSESCDGSSWYGPLCCANNGPDGLSPSYCLSTAVAQNIVATQVSSAMTAIINNVAAAIYQSTSLDDFCLNVGSALENTGLPETNLCLQHHYARLAAFGCNTGPGVQTAALSLELRRTVALRVVRLKLCNC